MPDANPYLAAAYVVFLALVLMYVAIMATRLGRLEKELAELSKALDERQAGSASSPEVAPEEVPA